MYGLLTFVVPYEIPISICYWHIVSMVWGENTSDEKDIVLLILCMYNAGCSCVGYNKFHYLWSTGWERKRDCSVNFLLPNRMLRIRPVVMWVGWVCVVRNSWHGRPGVCLQLALCPPFSLLWMPSVLVLSTAVARAEDSSALWSEQQSPNCHIGRNRVSPIKFPHLREK